MRLKLLIIVVLLALIGVSVALLATHAVTQSLPPTPSNLTATITGNNATKPTLHLTNNSAKACQVATTARGTVAVTKLQQGGKEVQPVALDTGSDDDIGYLLQGQLKTLQPGQSADIALAVYKLRSGYILRTTTWAPGAGAFGTQYAINANQPLQLQLNYSLPITPAKGAPACDGAIASTITGVMPWTQIAIVAAIILLIALLFVVTWLLRHRHKAAAATVAVLLFAAGLGLWLHQARPAFADITVPPELQSVFDGCMATFNANRDITGPALDVINNPANHIEIVHTTGVGSDMTGYDHTFTIYWNPDDNHQYAGTGGQPDACTSLFHEMYHALDMTNGTFSRDDCAGSGIETKEVMATRAQNLLRARLGLPQRSHYGDTPLPAGDCSAPADPQQCTGDHCGDTNGDPHLHTFDGLRYDFQAAGEFIAARNSSGSFEVQVRQQPWLDSRFVAINTAVALKIDGDKVELRAGTAMTMVVNGKTQPLASATLPGGGQLVIDQDVAILTWADGTKAFVRPVGTYGLALSVQPSASLAGKLQGLLGDADGNSKNDLHLRGSSTSIQPTYNALYPAFADSWRITDQTSLFTYPAGKTTASYTNHNFPDKLPDPKTLTNYAAAEALCKSMGVSDPTILANCALDVAITGRPEFARAAAHSQTFTAAANFSGTTWQLRIAHPGDTTSVTFQANAGDKIFIEVPQATLPSQCGNLVLIGPDGPISSGCIINGAGTIDTTTLPSNAQYTLQLTSAGSGSATARLWRIKDQQDTITPDGASVTARNDQPGVTSRFTFNGQAGQHIYVDAPSSTLPSQCGILRLLGPDDSILNAGCIINHSGNIDTTTLPATGQYTLVVDPTDTTTGQTQLRLIVATAETKPISLDGVTVTANLAKPGSTASFTFNGTAGQKIYVDVPSSQLPSQCGILHLLAPDGSTVDAGCIINHQGNLDENGTVLPATGQYVLVLDPSDNATGSTTLRLRSH